MLPSHNNNNVLLSISGAMNLPPDLSMDAGNESGWLLQATGKRTGDQFAVATLEFVSKVARKAKKVVNSPLKLRAHLKIYRQLTTGH